jgi:hypothetical protein
MKVWEEMSFGEQLLANVHAFISAKRHRQHESRDWPGVRVDAALEADRRIRVYRSEHEQRLRDYYCGAASEAYRRAWKRERHFVVFDRDFAAEGRFTVPLERQRVIGGGR